MKHDFFLKTTINLAGESKCVSRQVGALIVHDNRIISTGYNGTPEGHVNCNQVFDKNNFIREEHHKFSEQQEIHAEQNAICFAAKHGISTNNATLYCSLEPCDTCLKVIIACGIKKIYYLNDYDLTDKNNPLRKTITIEKISNEEIDKFIEAINELKH
jgi:dCMP deaminase